LNATPVCHADKAFLRFVIKSKSINNTMKAFRHKRSPNIPGAPAGAAHDDQPGQMAAAKAVRGRINALEPDHSESMHLLGTIACRSGNYRQAATWISAAIQCDPQNPIYYASLGDVLRFQGQLNQAVTCYHKALQIDPSFDGIYFKLGVIYHDRNDLNAAIDYYGKAVAQTPDSVEAHYNLGLVYQAMGRMDDAITSYDKAIAGKPDYPEAHNNKGKALKDRGDLTEAVCCFQRAIQLKRDFAEPYFNLGDVYAIRGQTDAAIDNYQQALRCRPQMVEAYNNLANAYKTRGDLDAAIENYNQVIRLKPDLAEAYYNLGSALRLKGEFQAAISHLKHALRLKPRYAVAHNNIALAFKNQGQLDAAIDHFSRALQINPHLAEAHWNRSFVYLLKGEFDKGWQDYDWRFRQARWKTLYPHRYEKPRWNGSPLPDQTLFIHDEQGLGDSLQFVRYIPAARSRCQKVIFETRRSLIPLLEGFPGIDHIIARSSRPYPDPNWDVYIPLMSLPKVMGTTLDTIPRRIPYIFADSQKANFWRQRLSGGGVKVGIVWAGRPQHTNDRNRSCRLEQFHPISKIGGIRLIGLQKGEAAAQARHMPAGMALTNYGEEIEDFSDPAGLIENLNLVIAVDTAVAHLAGAMGKPVWVLLPFVPDWRWMVDRADSPWYPTMRLFRQTTLGDWQTVFQRVKTALMQMVDASAARLSSPG
jgi:tetratricopeptide (TPR) repeat protein